MHNRSFMTCYDPKGVVERGKFWKSKTNSQKVEDKMKSQRMAKNLDKSLTNMSENLDKSQRPMFEVEVPKVRKNNSIIQKVDLEHKKTLKEIFKGLLRKISVKKSRLQNHNLSHLHSKQYDAMPPIVPVPAILQCTPCQDIDIVDSHAPIPSKDLSLRKLKAEAIPSKTVRHKAWSTKTGKRLDEDIIKRCKSQEKGPKDLKVVMKLDENEVKPIERAPNKGKLHCQICHKPQLGKTNDKKDKLKSTSQKLFEKEISRPRIVAKSQDQGEMTSTKMRKSQSGSRINRNEIPYQQSAASNTISKAKAQNNFKDRKRTVTRIPGDFEQIPSSSVDVNFRAYLDIANEVTERLQESQKVQPLLPTCGGNSRIQISLGQWVEEIYNAIDNLKSYSEISWEKLSADSLYALMERDMKFNGVINAIWEWGWRHGFSADEAEQIVNEVESLVFSGLIEEVLT